MVFGKIRASVDAYFRARCQSQPGFNWNITIPTVWGKRAIDIIRSVAYSVSFSLIYFAL